MCPVRVSPESGVFVYISETIEGIRDNPPTSESRLIKGDAYVLPEGKPLDYVVYVNGFPHDPGGMLTTTRLTTGTKESIVTITTPQDRDLSVGLRRADFDEVLYTAENPDAT